MMDIQVSPRQDAPLIFLYYNFRGQMQPIRNLLCYMQLPFHEVFLDQIESQKKSLPPDILQQVCRFKSKFDRNQLPALIHGELFMNGINVIAPYLALRFNRRQLFGTTIENRARLQEMLDLFYNKQPQSMMKIMDFVDRSSKLSPEAFTIEAKKSYNCHLSTIKYIKQCCQFIDQRIQQTFILGELTLIDFFFMECCNYLNGFYNHPDRYDKKQMQNYCRFRTHPLEKPNAYYIGVIDSYEKMMKSQPWYVKNRQYLESFSMVCKLMKQERRQALKKLWLGNPKMVV